MNDGPEIDARTLLSVAEYLAALAMRDSPSAPSRRESKNFEANKWYYLHEAERLYRSRRNREQNFPEILFGEPAWDMMLDLFINRLKGKRISVTSLCIASCVPSTTALRWLSILEHSNVVAKEPSKLDKRTTYLELTDEYFERLCRHFDNRRNLTKFDVSYQDISQYVVEKSQNKL